MIELEIMGAENILRMTTDFVNYSKFNLFEGMIEVANVIYDDIQMTNYFPQHVKDSVKLAEDRAENEVIIGFVYDESILLNGGTHVQWKLYRCNYRRYSGGQLMTKPTGPSLTPEVSLSQFWQDGRSKYLAMLQETIREAVIKSLTY